MAQENNNEKISSSQKEEFDHHKNHRERLRNKYLDYGIDSLTQVEVLEMLLFYAIPRKDTKPYAHSLLNKFGSLANVFEATEKELEEAGATPSSAFLIKFFNDVERAISYSRERRPVLKTYEEMGKFVCGAFKGCATEQVYAMFMDSQNRVLHQCMLGSGSFEHSSIDMRKLIETCICKSASKVVMAHNHPAGSLEASTDDYLATSAVRDALRNIGVALEEHFIVSGKEFMGIKKMETAYKSRFEDY